MANKDSERKADTVSRGLYQNLLEENQELQAAYEASRESEGLYRALFTHSPTASATIDPSTLSITQANDEASTLTGYAPDFLVGQNLAFLSPGVDEAGHWLEHACARLGEAEGGSLSQSGALMNAEGRRVAVEAVVRLIPYRDRAIILLNLHDLESRLKTDAEREASRKTEILREVAIAVSSKVNDPLFVILNDVATLQSGGLGTGDATSSPRLARILEAAQRIQRVTAQLSAITKPVMRDYLPGVSMLDLEELVAASVGGEDKGPQSL